MAAGSLGGHCVLACEIDPSLGEFYRKNFGLKPRQDIRDIKPISVPAHEVLCAGFPCQPFSKAGKQEGLMDRRRGGVVNNLLKIIEEKLPRWIILENVEHFINHGNGRSILRIKRDLKRLGYDVKHETYSPEQFGVPQHRKRMYLVADLKGLDDFKWPNIKKGPLKNTIKDIVSKEPKSAKKLNKHYLSCLETWQEFLDGIPKKSDLPGPTWAMEFGATYPFDRKNLKSYSVRELQKFRGSFGASLKGMSKEEILLHLPSHAQGEGEVFPKWKKRFIEKNRDFYKENRHFLMRWLPKVQKFPSSLQKLEWNCVGEKRNIWNYMIQFRASGVRVRRPLVAPSLVAMTDTQVPVVGWQKRFMTVRECAALQSMQRLKYLPKGVDGFHALGNAVNVSVVKEILGSLIRE